jgi:AhpD family alkylhydroperoxidase
MVDQSYFETPNLKDKEAFNSMNESLQVIRLLQEGRQAIQEALPGLMEGSSRITQSVNVPGLIPHKVKELIAVGIAVGIRCQPCIVHHVKEALDRGATADEIMEACSIAIAMGGGPSIAYTSYVVQALKDFKAWKKEEDKGGSQDAV